MIIIYSILSGIGVIIIIVTLLNLFSSKEWYVDKPEYCAHDFNKWRVSPGGTFQLRDCKKCGFIQRVEL